MTDRQIRTAFHNSILFQEHLCDDTIVLNELGLNHGESRADIAVLNGKLVGYEIKTEKDSLIRLPSQAIAYSKIFDQAYIITAEKHVEDSLKIIPEWWGVYTIVKTNPDLFKFKKLRKAKLNKWQDSYSLSQLLWKEEAIDVVSTIPHTNIKSNVTRHDLYELIAAYYKPKSLSKIVLRYLKQRTQWR